MRTYGASGGRSPKKLTIGGLGEFDWLGSTAIWLPRNLPLSLPHAHDGVGASHPHFQASWKPNGRRAIRPGGPVLGPHLRDQLRRRRSNRHPPRVPVRNELGEILE